MDYAESLTIVDDALKRLRETLPRGRWAESLDLAVLAEQHLRALAEECKRQDRLAHAPADHSPRPVPDKKVVFAHFHYPDER